MWLHVPFLLLFCNIIKAQDIIGVINDHKYADNCKIADELFKTKKYFEAIAYYENCLEKQTSINYQLLFNLAECLKNIRQYELAFKHYKKIADFASTRHPASLYYLGYCAQSLNNFEDAINYYHQFLNFSLSKPDSLISPAQQNIITCKQLLKQKNNNYQIEILPLNINKDFSTSSPIIFQNILFFTGIKKIKYRELVDMKNLTGYYTEKYVNRIFYSTKLNNNWTKRKELLFNLNDENWHLNSPSIDTLTNEIYFTVCNTICEIYKAKLNLYNTEPISLLHPPINLPDYSSRNPSISYFKNEKYLFFSSNRKEGKGEFDIYFAHITDDSISIKSIENINTAGNEISPFFDSEHEMLYFSSNSQMGPGNYDIYFAKGNPINGFESATHLPIPINSGADDFFLTKANEKTFYFSSNRNHKLNKKDGTCCDKIYEATLITRKLKLNLFITDEAHKKNIPAKIRIINNENLVVDSANTTKNQITFYLNETTPYFIEVNASNYLFKQLDPVIFNNDTTIEIILDKIEIGSNVVLSQIYFATGSDELEKKSKESLNMAVYFLTINPSLIIEIAGHTDDTGNELFNQTLSLNRAKAVYHYLVSAGISKERLNVVGYAANKPLVENTTEDNRQKNRRVEFLILDFIK
jgi:outer membrane protein OmpA-like peptidoglycan-associated protein